MPMVRGKVRVGDLVQGTVRVGSHTDIRFDGSNVVNASGQVLKIRPLRESLKAAGSK